MKVKFKALLKNEKVMYAVLFITAMSAFGYLMARNVEAITLMAAVGFLTWNFSKNMTIVLGTALLVTNMVYGVRRFEGFKEGAEEGVEESPGPDENDDKELPVGFDENDVEEFAGAMKVQEAFKENIKALDPMIKRLEKLNKGHKTE